MYDKFREFKDKIVKTEVIICPRCAGDGVVRKFYPYETKEEPCHFCNGRRVVERKVTTEYIKLK